MTDRPFIHSEEFNERQVGKDNRDQDDERPPEAFFLIMAVLCVVVIVRLLIG